MALAKNLRELLALLRSNGVEFVIVGAHALAFHGRPRFTGDLDILLRQTRENCERVLAALPEFGFGGLAITVDDLTRPDAVVQLGYEPNRVDLLTGLSGVTFDEVWESRITGSLEGFEVHFIGRERLV